MSKSMRQRSTESRGFSPGTPVSSHKENWSHTNSHVLSCDSAVLAKLNKIICMSKTLVRVCDDIIKNISPF